MTALRWQKVFRFQRKESKDNGDWNKWVKFSCSGLHSSKLTHKGPSRYPYPKTFWNTLGRGVQTFLKNYFSSWWEKGQSRWSPWKNRNEKVAELRRPQTVTFRGPMSVGVLRAALCPSNLNGANCRGIWQGLTDHRGWRAKTDGHSTHILFDFYNQP